MASNDPVFEQKAAEIIGLHLNPPQHAAIFCIDEKSAIQALDRLDRRLPFSPGVPNGMDLSITCTGLFPCSLRSIHAPVGWSAKRLPGIPAQSSWPSLRRLSHSVRPISRCTSF